MNLDTPTLLATVTITYFAGAVVLGSLALALRSLPATVRGGWALWAIAMLLSGTSAILIGLRGQIPDFTSIVIANALLLIGFGLRPNALSLLNGRGFAYVWLPAIAAVIWLGLYLAPWFRGDLSLRVIFVNGLCILALMLCIRECWPRRKQAQFSSWFLAGIFTVDALVRLSVVVLFFNSQVSSLKDAFQAPSLKIVIAVLLFAIVLKVIGLGMTVFEQLKGRFQELALSDPLTGLENRRSFFASAVSYFQTNRSGHGLYSLVTLEIDGLQNIIARFGPSMGDALVNLLGKICTDQAEAAAVVGRIRGNQIALFLPNTGKSKASAIAGSIRQSLAQEGTQASGNNLQITASAGVYWGDRQTGLTRAMEIADHCLKRAKSAGGDRTMVHSIQTSGQRKVETTSPAFAPLRHNAA